MSLTVALFTLHSQHFPRSDAPSNGGQGKGLLERKCFARRNNRAYDDYWHCLILTGPTLAPRYQLLTLTFLLRLLSLFSYVYSLPLFHLP